MTKREAIRECKRLWKEIEKSGKTKYGFLNSPAGERWSVKHYWAHCPLCEYVEGRGRTCAICPLVTQYGKQCEQLGFNEYGRSRSTPEWFEAVRGLKE